MPQRTAKSALTRLACALGLALSISACSGGSAGSSIDQARATSRAAWIEQFDELLTRRAVRSPHEMWMLGVYWDARQFLAQARENQIWREDGLPVWIGGGVYLADDGVFILGYYVGTRGADFVGIASSDDAEITWLSDPNSSASVPALFRVFLPIARDHPLHRELSENTTGMVVACVRHKDGARSSSEATRVIDARATTGNAGEVLGRYEY